MRSGLGLSVIASGLLGCMSTETIAPTARMALAQSTTGDTIRVPTENGGSVDFGPNATLHIEGQEVPAGEVYWNESGLYRKNGDFIAAWSDLRSVRVEQLDGAATVVVSATAALAIVIVAALLKNVGNVGGGGGKGGGSGGKAPSAGRSAPNPPSVPSDPNVGELVFRTAEAIGRASYVNGAQVPDDEPDTDVAIPLFSRGARRRANVRALARLEGSACWPGEGPRTDCVVGGARAGVRIVDLFELTAGIRTETSNNVTQPLAVVGGMIHGESPSFHWLALALGASVAFDGNRAHVIPMFSVRFRPVRGLWLGLIPLAPVYATDTGNWTMSSGVEITGEL